MRLYSSIALATMAVAIANPAMAKTVKHHHAKPAQSEGLTASEQLSMAQQQISQLQAQLNSLQSKVDSNATVAKTDTAAAASAAAAASTKAEKATTVAEAAKADNAKTAKIVDLTKWAADTKISGRMYFNTSAIWANGGTGGHAGDVGVHERDGGLQIKRAYIGIDHKFNNTFAFNVTMDADNIVRSKGVVDDSAKSSTQGFFIKKAYLEAKVDPALVLRFGSADLPWIPFVENIYGYRHIEKTVTDLNSFGTSADWGVHAGGQLLNNLIQYQVSAVDGSGYRNPQIGQHVDLEGRINVNYMGFTAAVGGYTGKLGAALNPGSVVNGLYVLGTTAHTARRFNALLSYKGKIEGMPVTIGGEYMWAKDDNQNQVAGYDLTKCAATLPVTCSTAVGEDTQEALSVFGSVSPVAKWSVFGRYDWAKPNGYTAAPRRNHYFNVGIQYEPISIVDLALVYKHNAADDAYASGDVVKYQTSRNEIGLFGQVKF